MTPEERQRRAENKTKRRWSKKKPGEPWPGYQRSLETRLKMGEAGEGRPGPNLGKLQSKETREKNRDSHLGVPKSDAHKEKLRAANLGKTGPNLGREFSQPWRENLSASMTRVYKDRPGSRLGAKHSEATRIRISAAKQNIPVEEWIAYHKAHPYCWKWEDKGLNIRKRVRAFWGGRCAFPGCGKTRIENRGRFLDVDHLSKNKGACCTGESFEWLFVPFCHDHHAVVDAHLDIYVPVFKKLIEEKYGGKSYYYFEEWKTLLKEGKLRTEDWGRRDGK